MHCYSSSGALLSNASYIHCRSDSDSRLYRRGSRWELSESGESTVSDLDETESGTTSESAANIDPNIPYPGIAPVTLRYLSQTTRPRSWCLALVSSSWFERVSMIVILLNCFTLGMYQPCSDKDPCTTNKCLILQRFDEFIFAFFSLEMTIKMIAMGVYGPGSYLADSWNRLDLFIVIAGAVEYGLPNFINFSAIRTIRVLRPLRAINRIPSMRILVMLLLDTLPMLGNVLLLCFFVFFIFGIIGVQLWQGILRQRCVLNRVEFPTVDFPEDLIYFYKPVDSDYICSKSHNSGMHFCANLPNYKNGNIACTLTYEEKNYPQYSDNDSYCVNWNQYYTLCSDKNHNPFQDTISFDNIGLAWIAIFLVISLEGWTEIMYYIQDGHSFWDWIYFVLLIVIGSFFMINLCLVVIATQFSETKKREMERMRLERARFQSSSTLASSTNNSEPSSCYAEIIKYIAHLWRRSKRKVLIKIRFYILRRNQRSQLIAGDTIRLNYGKQHHPNCSKLTLISSANLLSPASVSSNTRRSSVMFSDLIILHGQNSSTTAYKKNVCSSEKTTQAGDGNIWQIATASDQPDIQTQQIQQQCNNLMNGETLTCQELLALGAINAALSTGQILLDIFFNSITKGIKKDSENNYLQHVSDDNFSCCQDLWQCEVEYKTEKRTKLYIYCCLVLKGILKAFKVFRKKIKKIVVHKCFQEGILVAILINTLSMGIEHHNQAEILTHIVEVTNIIFSAIFGVEMLLKIIAEGPFGYISNGFNVFDGIIVVLSAVELFRNCTSDLHTDSGLSVLRTFRLLRILKLVRFMPNLRRQLFVMLRTMDNVAIFFSLLILFIFIFSILGMYLFGGKFCVYVDDYGSTKECTCESMDNIRCRCDRKHFNNILWATVTVFQILTQEDWNIVLSNGMAKTSNWAALYFVALMTFGNYVLFNLLVAILVEGFSSERNERREREQRELAKRKMSCIIEASLRRNCGDSNYSLSSSSENCFPEYKNYWKPDEARNVKNLNQHAASCDFKDIHLNGNYPFRYRDPKSNIQKESLARLPIKRSSPPIITHTAATPQDSPSMTLKEFSEFQFQNSKLLVPPKLSPPPSTFRQFKHSSVDDSNSRVCKIVTYNEKSGPNTVTYSEKVGPAFCTGSTKHLASRSSWEGPRKVATKSSFKKSKNVSEVPAENIPLNNGRHHSQCSGKGQSPIPAHLRRKNYFKKTSIQENQVSKNSNVHAKKNNTNTIKFVNKSNEKILPQLSIDKGIKARIKKKISSVFQTADFLKNREDYSLYLFSPDNKFRKYCCWVVKQAWFDNLVLIFIAQNCITLAMERPNIPPDSPEKIFLQCSNYIFSIVFATEMFIKVVASGMCYGPNAYFTSGWNVMDGSLVIISVVDIIMFLINDTTSRIFGILRVFRLLRSLRPLRVINRAPGLKLVVQTLLSSLRPIGNIVLICCTFFIIFGILGVQLFKGSFYYCVAENLTGIETKDDCIAKGYNWKNQKYNFDDLVQALMSLFVLSSRDGWVNIMYTGLDAVGVDRQPKVNYSEWRLLYFIAFILLVGFFVLNMFVGVVVENFHRCREEQEKEEKIRKAAKRALQMEKRRRKMNELPYYIDYPPWRLEIHKIVTSKYFDLAIALVIGLNVITMATERYHMPDYWEYALRIFNYFFTAVFILESTMKLVALGIKIYVKDKWNLLDVAIVILSVVGIVIEEIVQDLKIIPINPTIIRVLRVMRIARVLKLLKMAKGIRALLDTVMQALPQVGNLGLLFFLLFFIFAALGVELFGRLDCSCTPCQGLGEHAHFQNFGMAFLTLFRVATGDNWNGIMKDTLDDEHCDHGDDCINNCCISPIIAPIFFVIFVLMAQFVLVNVVVAVLMKHLEESHKQLEDEHDMDVQLEREFVEKQERNARELYLALQADQECQAQQKKTLVKVMSLPSDFTYTPPGTKVTLKIENPIINENISVIQSSPSPSPSRKNLKSPDESMADIYSIGSVSEEIKRDKGYQQNPDKDIFLKDEHKNKPKVEQNPSFLMVPQEREVLLQRSGSVKNLLRKQLSMDISEESAVLLSIPSIPKVQKRQKNT
ncbi:voltage-dependent T-type calcium channel subunit alpha-1G isoform X3 [Diabrotica virgifera virgifera]|uniref:Ion transport domain-containing protein n=1 Tax=Diabrotica virgifera virgifera TaxID=50390 RepID=A0ABM5KWJ7_DIAVI|nr:voltage-dependent T-type calcium channel subunit alpha-1G isoform X3 [Diabrotica virgifera virgifera]